MRPYAPARITHAARKRRLQLPSAARRKFTSQLPKMQPPKRAQRAKTDITHPPHHRWCSPWCCRRCCHWCWKIPKFSQLRGSGVAWLPFRGGTGGPKEPPGRSPAGAGAGAQPPDPSREQPGRERRKTQNSDNRSDLGADFADRRAVRTSRVASESLAQIRGRISPAVCKSSLAGKRP